jgi:hypothetical protein
MRFSYLLYGILASMFFLLIVSIITELLNFADYTFIAICILFGTMIICTLYIAGLIKDS